MPHLNLHKTISRIIPCICIASTLSCLATEAPKNLPQLTTQIENLKQDISTQQANRNQLQQTLEQAETSLGQLNTAHKNTSVELKKQQASLASLEQQQLKLQTSITRQQQQIAQQIHAAYVLGQQNYLKMLLNQQDPAQVNRNLTYYRYFIKQHLDLINQLNINMQQLAANQLQITRHTADLTTLLAQQQQQIQQIKANQEQRRLALQQLNAVITSKGQRLNALLADKQALESVVQKLQTQATAAPANVRWQNYTSLAQAQGKLNWPTKGKIISRFNTPIENSELKSNGVIIAAPEGQNVYAIAPGKVIFSQWLSGYGLLLIVSHDHNFMTLYGRNNSLNKKVGDQVAAGEMIATVGKTGGYAKPGLYFEIRNQGKAADPAKWCGRM